MKTSILFVIDNLQFGGGERVFSQIINGLDPRRYNFFIASIVGENFYKAIKNKHVKFLPLDFSKKVNFRLFLQLKKIIKTNNIQIVHGQGTRAEFYARIAHKLAGNSRYVSTIAMPVEGFNIGIARKKIYRFFDWISEKFVDRFIVVSDSLKEVMEKKRGITPDKIFRIHNGIEMDRYRTNPDDPNRVRLEFKIGQETVLIGAAGRLVWQKGFEYLIEAIPGVIKAHPDVKILIIGDGPLKESLKAQGARLKLYDSLIFTGFRDDMREILSAIDILVIPSLLEGFPMITLEGMAMAKPIIATSIHGISEQIIDGESGILIPPKNPIALAEALCNLLRDTKRMKDLGLNARKRAEKQFSVEKMITETEKVFQSLCGSQCRQS